MSMNDFDAMSSKASEVSKKTDKKKDKDKK